MKRIVAIMVTIVAFYGSFAQAATGNGRRVLIVPARYTVIKLAFDVAALRDVILISYDKNELNEPVMYRWDSLGSKWEPLTLDEFEIGSFCLSTPREMILVGSDRDLPPEIISGATQARKITRIKTLKIVDMVNSLDKSLKFSPAEWKALARHNHFTIKDYNYEKRRWGRYGPPKPYRQNMKNAKHKQAAVSNKSKAPIIIESEEQRKTIVIETDPAKNTPKDKTQFEKLEAELDSMLPADAAKGLELKVQPAPKKVVDAGVDVPLDLPPASKRKAPATPVVDEILPEDK
jgi:hypothetical protein